MRPFGLTLVLLAPVVPAFWFAGLASQYDNAALLSQYCGIAALITMSIVQILATRTARIETIFGSMDRVYVLHKWLAVLAVLLVFLHDTIGARMRGLGRGNGLSDFGETLGEFSYYGLLVLAAVSIATFVPYHLWKYSHKFMGALFAAGATHFVLMKKPFALTDLLGIYTLTFCTVGILAYIYTLFPAGLFKGWRRYTITHVEDTGGALAVSLAPVDQGHQHRAGQFAFLKFEAPGPSEIHPFTISQAANSDTTLRFTIKDLGDYTGSLPRQLNAGMHAKVSRPYGHFHLHHGGIEQVWIAAGVGITPFMAWAAALRDIDGPVHLFFCVTSRSAAPHIEELEAIAAAKSNLNLHLIESSTAGRLTADHIIAKIQGPKKRISFAFCGPKLMREALFEQLSQRGFSRRKFRYEEFEIRSGLGLRKLLGWLTARLRRDSNQPEKPVPAK